MFALLFRAGTSRPQESTTIPGKGVRIPLVGDRTDEVSDRAFVGEVVPLVGDLISSLLVLTFVSFWCHGFECFGTINFRGDADPGARLCGPRVLLSDTVLPEPAVLVGDQELAAE